MTQGNQGNQGFRYNPNAIERRAESCVRHCLSQLSLTQVPLPIPIDNWIEGPLNLRFGIEDLSRFGEDVLGASFVSQREILVSESLLNNEGRFRFTIAHELGHFILHANLNVHFRDTHAEPNQKPEAIEREADRFAAAFLMPRDVVIQSLLIYCQSNAIDSASLPQSYADHIDILKKFIAKLFGVSPLAAEYRLKEILSPTIGPFATATQTPWLLTP